MDALADTCFFIDLQRRAPTALDWVKVNSEARIFASVITYGELAAGQTHRPTLDNDLVGIPLLAIDIETAWLFGNLVGHLRQRGSMIGPNDLWIAATALASGIPILTRNVNEFKRVPGLSILSY